MVDLLEALDRLRVGSWLATGALVAARVAPLTVLLPYFRLPRAAPLLRAVVVVGLSAALAPVASASGPQPPAGGVSFGLALVSEGLIGLLFAFCAGLPLFALDWAGRLVDALRGASMAQLAGPDDDAGSSPMGQLYLLLGVVLFVALGGPRLTLAIFAEGLRVAPVGAPIAVGHLSAAALEAARLAGLALAFAFVVSAPAAVAVLIVDLLLGLSARAAPQLPLHFTGMPLRAAAALAGSALAIALLTGALAARFRAALDAAAAVLRGLGS